MNFNAVTPNKNVTERLCFLACNLTISLCILTSNAFDVVSVVSDAAGQLGLGDTASRGTGEMGDYLEFVDVAFTMSPTAEPTQAPSQRMSSSASLCVSQSMIA